MATTYKLEDNRGLVLGLIHEYIHSCTAADLKKIVKKIKAEISSKAITEANNADQQKAEIDDVKAKYLSLDEYLMTL
ncbi:hypothetical protein LCGC14_2677480 [marine sediment metagenome]|uniref:Uncharacterized protein n=1 Tax=marine sediment metagenome TaxID=412755 RepID=A0A0F8ZMA5_9ZZZZ